jgi:diphosphomevalonate decarboxylase
MKATAISHPDIAFIKYWGKKIGAEDIRLPANGSISMVLSELYTKTTVEFSEKYSEDVIKISNQVIEGAKKKRVTEHLDRIRAMASIQYKARVQSEFNFPMSAGISSSASGFSALTVAAVQAAGITMSKKELSKLARKASGSACRPIMDGFVEWLDGDTDETSYAQSIFPPDHWNLYDVVAIISKKEKTVPTTNGMASAETSPFFSNRLKRMPDKITLAKKLIQEKNFQEFGELIEAEALEMHAIALTSKPPLLYWIPETVKIMELVQNLRAEGIMCYFTINTGQNVHILVESNHLDELTKRLKQCSEVQEIFINKPSEGAHLIQEHLF